MTLEYLRVDITDGIATVTIDRPPVNAMNRRMYAEIVEVMQSFDANRDVRAAILASASERAFLAGADLKERFVDNAPVDPIDPNRAPRDCFMSIYECAVPVIAAVNNVALGAGLAVVSSCDVIVAAEDALFGLPEIDVGLLGGGAHLSRLVPQHRLRQMYYTGERVPAAELYRLGSVASLVRQPQLLDEARRIAANIATKSPIAIRLAKQALNRIEALPLREAYRLEQDYTTRLRSFEDSAEAATAFLEKREPKFSWR